MTKGLASNIPSHQSKTLNHGCFEFVSAELFWLRVQVYLSERRVPGLPSNGPKVFSPVGSESMDDRDPLA